MVSEGPTPDDVLAAREARGARSEQDVDPARVAIFTLSVVGIAWVWLGLAWAVVAAVFVVPPWLIVTTQARVSRYRRISPAQRAAIRRVRLWNEPWVRYGALLAVALVACVWVTLFVEQRGAPERIARLVGVCLLLPLKPLATRLQGRAAAGHRLFARTAGSGARHSSD